jgi:lysophospholipase L1-like esterase
VKTEDERDGNRGAKSHGVGPRWALGAALLGGAIAIAGVTAGPASAASHDGGHGKAKGADHSHSHGHGGGGSHGHGQGKGHGKGHGEGHNHAHGHGKSRDADYVALGDSYASGPAIPGQIDANCARSDHNYPHDVAVAQHTHLTDVTCSGATTAEMTAPQGTAPAQFAALGRTTDLVTVSIGGNDIGFSTIVGTCAQLGATDPAGAPCHTHYTSGGTDQLKVKIQQTAPKIAQVIRGIHQRAPHAKVQVVGYPDLLPDSGTGRGGGLRLSAGHREGAQHDARPAGAPRRCRLRRHLQADGRARHVPAGR